MRPQTAGSSVTPGVLHGAVQVTSRLRARLAVDPAGGAPQHPTSEPVTVTVARVVRADRRKAFERWAADLLQVAAGFPGNLGATLLRPGRGSSEYHLVYRFTDEASLAAWERSPERRGALARMQEMVEEERYVRVAGLESFFTRPPRPGPRWRMTVLTVAAVFAITSLLQALVLPYLAGLPMALRLLASAVVVVLALGHVAIPLLTRLFAGWLHPQRD